MITFLFIVLGIFICGFYFIFKDINPKKPTYDKILTTNLPPIPHAKPMFNDQYGWNKYCPKFVRFPALENLNYSYSGQCRTFTVIDFETANSYPDSVCALGIVRVENNTITRKISYYIRPPYKCITNSEVNGINWKFLETAPDFSQIWDDIKPLIDGQIITGYNINFDAGCLEALFKCYGITNISYAAFDVLDTAKSMYKDCGLKNFKLKTVTNHAGITYNSFIASEGAAATAKLQILANRTGEIVSVKCKNMTQTQMSSIELLLIHDSRAFTIAKEQFDNAIKNNTNDFTKVLPYINRIIEESESKNYLAKAHRLYGEIFEIQGNDEEALLHFEKALSYDEKVGVKNKVNKLKKKFTT